MSGLCRPEGRCAAEIPLPRRAEAMIAACESWAFPRANRSRYNMAATEVFQEAAMPKINRDGVKIYYEVHCSGPALLLTHGYSSTSAMWQGQMHRPSAPQHS